MEVTILIVVLIEKIYTFDEDIIFNLVDRRKIYNKEETTKSLKSCTNEKTSRITIT